MDIVITTFKSPFSFFCLAKEDGERLKGDFLHNTIVEPAIMQTTRMGLSEVTHGQYVAVLWKNKWTRGLVTMESQFLIWLIDYGIYLRPDDKTVYVNLPATHKSHPTKIFEASIHGVAPVDKTLTEECEIKNKICTQWNAGSIEKAQSLIASASKVYFVPVALMETKYNDVVLGDLYLELKNRGVVNIVDELELWPVFLQKNKAAYIENLSTHYTSRRKHRASLLKPAIADSGLTLMNLETSYSDYYAICEAKPQLTIAKECNDDYEDGSTVLEDGCKSAKDKNMYKLTPAEIEKYSNMYFTVSGQEFNVLNILTNKIRDLKMCDKYKDHDLKSVGRATYRTDKILQYQNFLSNF